MKSPLRILTVSGALLVFTNGPLFLITTRVLDRPQRWEDPVVRTTLAVTGAVMAAMVLLDRFHPSQPRPVRSNPVAATESLPVMRLMLALVLAVILTTLPLDYRWLRNRYGSNSAALATSTAGLDRPSGGGDSVA